MKRARKTLEGAFRPGLRRIRPVSFYADTRGWFFIVSWCHRITGILAAVLVLFHVLAFRAGPESERFFLLVFFQWVLSIPVIFHAFNGARIILYECYGRRDDESMLRWVLGLLSAFVLLLGLLILMGGQTVSPFFYWMLVSAGGLAAAYALGAEIWNTKHSVFWRLQRVSGAFLLIMIPAYILFMHIHPAVNPGTGAMVNAIQSVFQKAVYGLLLFAALFHGGYGVWSALGDYVSSKRLQRILVAAVACLFLVFLWIGLRRVMAI
jgi:succinate dehydrogenase hydrophobic anchor subunit